MVLVSIWQNNSISHIPLSEQLAQWAYALAYLLFLVFRINNRILHITYLSIQLIGWIVYIVTDMSTL